MKTIGLLLCLGTAAHAGAVCVDWKAMGEFADVDFASAVFEGVVLRIEPGDMASCSPDRVVFRVERQWKGQPAGEITLLQDNGGRITEPGPDGRPWNRGCPTWAEGDRFDTAGARYIVLAAGPANTLRAMGCGTSNKPTGLERRRLDRWKSLVERAGGPTKS